MRAVIFTEPGAPLEEVDLAEPLPGRGQVQLQVKACGVCRTDLHILDGELAEPKLPLVLGHQIVGTVSALGPDVSRFTTGQRVGVPWLGWTCGECAFFAGRAARTSAIARAWIIAPTAAVPADALSR